MPKALLLHVGTDKGNTSAFGIGNGRVFSEREPLSCSAFSNLPLFDFEFRYGLEIQDSSEHFHKDPDFEHFTYGEPRIGGEIYPDDINSRAKQISKLNMGDSLFFVSSLADVQGALKKYLVGAMRVRGVYEILRKPDIKKELITPLNRSVVDDVVLEQIRQNAHFKRTREHFWCTVGEKEGRQSAMLRKAIPLTEEGVPFAPNEIGRKIWGGANYHMGWKWVYDESRFDWLWSSLSTCKLIS